MTPLQQAILRMHMGQLDSLDMTTRVRAGIAVCKMCGVLEVVRGLTAGGALHPPPEWPLVDVVPERAEVHGDVRMLAVKVRTVVHGVVLHDVVRVAVPLADGALADAVERGKRGLRGRIDGMVVNG